MHCSGVQCNALQWGAMQCIAVGCNPRHCSWVQCNALQWGAMQRIAFGVKCNALQCLHMCCRGMLRHVYPLSKMFFKMKIKPVTQKYSEKRNALLLFSCVPGFLSAYQRCSSEICLYALSLPYVLVSVYYMWLCMAWV